MGSLLFFAGSIAGIIFGLSLCSGYTTTQKYREKMKKMFLTLLAAVLFCAAGSCSKDDTPGDPEGTAMLNMYNEQNGKTMLDDSDIYINDAGNFISPSDCQIFMLGKRSGLGDVQISALKNPATEVAVTKGYGYVAVRGAAARMFPSQNVALPLDPALGANYLKFYVADNIEDTERGNLGAVVKFVIETPQNHGLPEWGSAPYKLDYSSKALMDKVAVTMPSDNIEAELDGKGELVCEKQGRKLVFTLLEWPSYGSGSTYYTLRLRIGESYTEVRVALDY